MLTRGQQERPEDLALPGEQIKDPFVLEFLDLKDEYSENDLETFLLELGDDFCFIGRQRRCASEASGTGWTCCSTTGA